MRRLQAILFSGLLALSAATVAQGNEWMPVTGTETLRNFMSDRTAERTLPGGEVSRGEYRSDGTGTLYAWGASIPRTWSVKGDDQICITAESVTQCYTLERNATNPDLYRARDVATGALAEFRVTEDLATVIGEPKGTGNEGGAATASAAELAAELSNPNTAVATLTFKNQFRWFKGDLPDADGQSSYTLLFQPSLPFVLPNEAKILWRPAIPIIVDQPIFDPSTGSKGNLVLAI